MNLAAPGITPTRERVRAVSVREDLRDYFVSRRTAARAHQWPSLRWRHDPVGFAREVLLTELWSKQVELVDSVLNNRNTTCRSGHKCGKTTAIAVIALWFFATFDRARVLCTAVKREQIDDAIWLEITRLYRLSQTGPYPLDGEMNTHAKSGLVGLAGRKVWGLTAQTAEGMAGISSPNMLVLVDEASGVKDRFFEVLDSSIAGSGGTVRKVLISNPTRTQGVFYRSHTVDAALYSRVHINSEETPNALGTGMVNGLCGPEYITEKKTQYGEDSYAYAVRVRGEFVKDKDGKVISLNDIALAQSAWHETSGEGDLQIGVDPAGDGVLGDESVIAVRTGNRIATVLPWRGISEDSLVTHVLDQLEHYRLQARGVPRIFVDAGGGIGTRVYNAIKAVAEARHLIVDVFAVRSENKLWGSREYDTIRDQLWGETRDWIRAGGALPDDVKLVEDLNAPSFTANKFSQSTVTPKKELRKALGRSPDRGDAVCLAIRNHAAVDTEADTVTAPSPRSEVRAHRAQAVEDPRVVNDPYAGAAMWQGRR